MANLDDKRFGGDEAEEEFSKGESQGEDSPDRPGSTEDRIEKKTSDEKSADDSSEQPSPETKSLSASGGDKSKSKRKNEVILLKGTIKELEEELERTRSEKEESRNLALRKQAEMENFRRRIQREQEDFRRYALTDLLTEILPVLDSLNQAIHSAKLKRGDDDPLIAGIFRTLELFKDKLAHFGLTAIEEVDTPFDPEVHSAVATKEGHEEVDTVTEVYQEGYRLGDRILRPALVMVAKAAQKRAEKREEKAKASEETGKRLIPVDFEPETDPGPEEGEAEGDDE